SLDHAFEPFSLWHAVILCDHDILAAGPIECEGAELRQRHSGRAEEELNIGILGADALTDSILPPIRADHLLSRSVLLGPYGLQQLTTGAATFSSHPFPHDAEQARRSSTSASRRISCHLRFTWPLMRMQGRRTGCQLVFLGKSPGLASLQQLTRPRRPNR